MVDCNLQCTVLYIILALSLTRSAVSDSQLWKARQGTQTLLSVLMISSSPTLFCTVPSCWSPRYEWRVQVRRRLQPDWTDPGAALKIPISIALCSLRYKCKGNALQSTALGLPFVCLYFDRKKYEKTLYLVFYLIYRG